MEQEVPFAPSQFTEVKAVKVLFIKLTTERVKSRYTSWPDLLVDSPARFMAAEIEATNNYQYLNLNLLKSAEAIFFVFEPEEFSNQYSQQAENFSCWLETIENHEGFKDAKQFFLVNAKPSTFDKTKFCEKLQRLITEPNKDKSVVLLENEEDIIYCPYPKHNNSSDKPIDQSIVCNDSEIVYLLEQNFSQRFTSRPLPPPKPPRIASKQTLKRSIEIAIYAGFLFLSTLGIVILLGAILGGVSGGWIDIIANSSSWIFDVNLLNNAIDAVFNGLGTPWSLGVVISAFLLAGLVAAVVVSWGAYDHFHPEILPEVVIGGEGWEITANSDSKLAGHSINSKAVVGKPHSLEAGAGPKTVNQAQSGQNLNKF